RELEDLLARSRQAVTRRQLFEHLDPEAFLKLGNTSQHGRVVHTEALGGSPHRASARDGKKVSNVIPVDHGAIPHRAVRLPKPVSNTSNSSTGGHHSLCRQARPYSGTADTDHRGWRQSSSRIAFAPPMCALLRSTRAAC